MAVVRRIFATPQFLTDAMALGATGGSPESREVAAVVRALVRSPSLPLPGDLYVSLGVPREVAAVRVRAHGRRMPQRNLWVWYLETARELTLVGLTRLGRRRDAR